MALKEEGICGQGIWELGGLVTSYSSDTVLYCFAFQITEEEIGGAPILTPKF
jgi:hypothetical protein